MADQRHPGISMHKLPIGGGFIGLVFTAGTALIFLLGLPALWYFVVFSAALGLGLAFVFRVVNRSRSERARPLSILEERPLPAQRVSSSGSCRNLLRVLPAPYPS